MDPAKLDQRSVQKCVAQRSDPNDHPKIPPGRQAEYHSCDHTGNVAEDPGVLEPDLSRCSFLDDQGNAVIGSDPHLRRHIKGDAQPGEQTADQEEADPQGKTGDNPQHILDRPADQIRPVSYADHVHDRPCSNTFSDREEHQHQDRCVHDQLPAAKAHSDKLADPQVHAGERIHAESTQAVAAHTDTDKEDPDDHHGAPFHKISIGSVHLCAPSPAALRI